MTQADYLRQWRKKNREDQNRKAKVRNKQYRQRMKDFVDSLKQGKPCKDCGVSYPNFVMDYDHLGDKEFNISKAVHFGYSKERIIAEIAKCDLVCANCHRIRTHS